MTRGEAINIVMNNVNQGWLVRNWTYFAISTKHQLIQVFNEDQVWDESESPFTGGSDNGNDMKPVLLKDPRDFDWIISRRWFENHLKKKVEGS